MAIAGDVHVQVARDETITAKLIEADGEIELSGRDALLRPRGQYKPELMVMLLNQGPIQRSIISLDRRTNTSIFGFQARAIKDMTIALPDPQTQEMMWKAHLASGNYLQQQAENYRKVGDTMDKMAEALAIEILRGKLTPKQAVQWLGQTIMPRVSASDKPKQGEVATHTKEDIIAGKGDGGRLYVLADDHYETVERLEAQLAALRENIDRPGQDVAQAPRKKPSP